MREHLTEEQLLLTGVEQMSCVAVLLLAVAATARAEGTGDRLIGYWPLRGDCRDHSGNANHAVNHGADLTAAGRDGAPNTAARFDGIADYLEVADSPSLRLGTGDFSVSAWIHTEDLLDDVIGDLVSKYDPALRRGLNLGIVNHAGMTSSQSNYRNIQFGIDNGRADQSWTDCGRPGNAIFRCGMAVHRGDLYVGTWPSGSVFHPC